MGQVSYTAGKTAEGNPVIQVTLPNKRVVQLEFKPHISDPGGDPIFLAILMKDGHPIPVELDNHPWPIELPTSKLVKLVLATDEELDFLEKQGEALAKEIKDSEPKIRPELN